MAKHYIKQVEGFYFIFDTDAKDFIKDAVGYPTEDKANRIMDGLEQ